jgi:3-hydroxybutyryl-CoA dehydrogenase
MTIAILSDNVTRQEILDKGIPQHIEVLWPDSVSSLVMLDADVRFDLQFRFDRERISQFKQVEGYHLIIGSNEYTCKEIGLVCSRINDWPGFINRPVIEIATGNASGSSYTVQINGPDKMEQSTAAIKMIMDTLEWKYSMVPDIEGFISSRIISGIINEAYYTLEAGVSTKEEIDIAMKLGTNYPHGPFEWKEQIGLLKIYSLLEKLAHKDDRYIPAQMMRTEWEKLQNEIN